jgi:integrase
VKRESLTVQQACNRFLQIKAMLLLGINAAFGPSDIGKLSMEAIDLRDGWLDLPRLKTATERRIPLWPDTIEAPKAYLKIRPKPAEEQYELSYWTEKSPSKSWGRVRCSRSCRRVAVFCRLLG